MMGMIMKQVESKNLTYRMILHMRWHVVAETLGGLAKDTITLIGSIGKALSQRSNPRDPQTSIKHLFDRFVHSL